MPQFLIAVFILWFVFYGMRMFAQANPAVLAKGVKLGGGVVSLAVAGLMLLRGQVEVGLGLGGLAFWLLGWASAPSFMALKWPRGTKTSGNRSRVRSAMIEMELDHDSGAMQGKVLAGPFEGKALAELTRPQCESLYAMSGRDDPDGARLLEAYLDRRFPGWRPAGEGQQNAGSGSADPRRPNAMSEDEAYEILGLKKGASAEDISRAHRGLMKKLHPDAGGTTSLAARVNEAKDVLMRRHG